MAEYLQLGPNDYVQFPDGLSPADKQTFATRAAVAYKTVQAQQAADSQQADLQYAQQNGTSLMGRRQAEAQQILQNQTTPGQQLREDNNPVTQGLQAGASKFGEGILGKLGAIGAGLGQASGTTAHNILSNIPGLGGPAGVIPAAGAALAHAGGTFLGDTVTGNLIGSLLARAPTAAVDAINAVRAKGVGGAAKDLLPTITKEGKINQLASQTLGQPATFGERVANPVANDAKTLYKVAETQAPVPTQDLANHVFDALQHEDAAANPNSITVKTLGGLYNKFSNSPNLAYSDVLDEAQRLRKTAQGLQVRQPQAAATLNDVRQGMLDLLDQTSPVARQAGQLYRKDLLAKDVLEALRTPSPGDKIRTMLEQDPKIATTFGLDTPDKIEAFAKQADKIGAVKTRAQLLTRYGAGAIGAGLVGWALRRKLDSAFSGD
jgi:hypothetical protein